MKRILKVCSSLYQIMYHHHILLTGVSAMNNMKQLEYLMRLHVMIAMVYIEGDEKSLQNFLASVSYIMLIWKVQCTTRLCMFNSLSEYMSFTESLQHHSQRKP